MGDNSISSGENNMAKTTGWENVLDPLLDILKLEIKESNEKKRNTNLDSNVEAGWDNSAFIDSANKIDYNLTRSMIIDDFEFTDVS